MLGRERLLRTTMASAWRINEQRTPSPQPRVWGVAEGNLAMTVAPLERLEAAEGVLPPLVVRDDVLLAAAVSVAVPSPAILRVITAFPELGSPRFLLPRLLHGLCDYRFPSRCCLVAHHQIE